MSQQAVVAYLLTDGHGRQCIKIDRTAAALYAAQHHCTIEGLILAGKVRSGLAEDPPRAKALWSWEPEAGA